jgi:hypothetical protein
MKKPLRSSARGASFHTKHASNANVVLLDDEAKKRHGPVELSLANEK